jgi:hypothetical protein
MQNSQKNCHLSGQSFELMNSLFTRLILEDAAPADKWSLMNLTNARKVEKILIYLDEVTKDDFYESTN